MFANRANVLLNGGTESRMHLIIVITIVIILGLARTRLCCAS